MNKCERCLRAQRQLSIRCWWLSSWSLSPPSSMPNYMCLGHPCTLRRCPHHASVVVPHPWPIILPHSMGGSSISNDSSSVSIGIATYRASSANDCQIRKLVTIMPLLRRAVGTDLTRVDLSGRPCTRNDCSGAIIAPLLCCTRRVRGSVAASQRSALACIRKYSSG